MQSLVGALRVNDSCAPPPPTSPRVDHIHAYPVYVVNKAVDKGHWKCGSYPEKSDTECYKSDVVLLENVPGGTERDASDGHKRAQYEVE